MPFKVYTNLGKEVEFEEFVFPGGEVHVRLKGHVGDEGTVYAEIRNSDDIMKLFLLESAITEQGGKYINLVMPYIPYARQDRVCNPGEPFSMGVFGSLIDDARFYNVVTCDPHSDVAWASIHSHTTIGVEEIIKRAEIDWEEVDGIISPDAGATKKVFPIAQAYDIPFLQALKIRDTSTGDITRTQVVCGDGALIGSKILIIDDLCDGGRTFVELGKVLKRDHGVERVELYVTHGLFSKGLDVFEGNIDKIHCAFPWIEPEGIMSTFDYPLPGVYNAEQSVNCD